MGNSGVVSQVGAALLRLLVRVQPFLPDSGDSKPQHVRPGPRSWLHLPKLASDPAPSGHPIPAAYPKDRLPP